MSWYIDFISENIEHLIVLFIYINGDTNKSTDGRQKGQQNDNCDLLQIALFGVTHDD